MPIQSFYYFLCVVLFSCHFHTIFAEDQVHPRKHPLKSYLLPATHSLNKPLEQLFRHSSMFHSPKYLTSAGFKVKVSHNRLMVAGHPDLPYHLIKKFIDRVPQTNQIKNFIKRIRGAKRLRQYINKLNLQHIVVPQKWLYQLSSKFPRNSYVLVVEKMDIYDDWDNPNGEARRLYYHMDKEILTEFCILLHAVGGCDSIPRNQPFTKSGQIAFIDTEHVGEYKGHFYKHILPALNPELQVYATALWEKLEDEEKQRKHRH